MIHNARCLISVYLQITRCRMLHLYVILSIKLIIFVYNRVPCDDEHLTIVRFISVGCCNTVLYLDVEPAAYTNLNTNKNRYYILNRYNCKKKLMLIWSISWWYSYFAMCILSPPLTLLNTKTLECALLYINHLKSHYSTARLFIIILAADNIQQST